ncbi:response regulator [Brevibacillus humidisoli]|uniref:response regulator n=1 Tax=Brevibacillus humidisoli TaxID=2895522 RepID=UPI001E5D7BF4|nr:response regulator [Brevibacillus humidisoli]
MPKMDGMKAARHILRHDENAIIFICTAMGQSHLKEEAQKIGVKEFIVKPFQSSDILQTIHTVFGSQE